MVESKSKKKFYFFVFLIPSFLLYTIFFIWPFFNGLYISLTNWDGLTPKAPINMDAFEFESTILNKLKKQADKDYLLSIYHYSDVGDSYSRFSLSGGARRKVESIIAKSGYEPERYRFVGLGNYLNILKGNVSDTFYPRFFGKSFYNSSSSLPQVIAKKNFSKNFLNKLSIDEKKIFFSFYEETESGYTLNPAQSEFGYEDTIWLIPEFEVENRILAADISNFISNIKKSSLLQDNNTIESLSNSFITEHGLSIDSSKMITEGVSGLYHLGQIKILLADKWQARGFDLGVIGFTLFFAFFSVIGINLLAFALALALDSGIKGQKYLRSVFFLPNVLSMIIVALIWKMLFFQMFPRITGIDQWLSDPAKTPWLIVLVAVWQGAGYYMIVYLAGLQNIPTDVIEAAKIDGASPIQRFSNITLPLLVPAFTISLFLTIANALKSFDLIYAMTSGSAYTYGTVPLVLDIYFDAFARKQAGLATAKAMLLFVVIFIITGIQLYVLKKKEVEQ